MTEIKSVNHQQDACSNSLLSVFCPGMHSRLNTFILLLGFTGTLLASNPDEVKSYLWGLIQFAPKEDINYETGYWNNQLFHRREFHSPITSIPVEIRYGSFFYGGGGLKGDKVKSSWIQYDESVSGFDGGSFTTRLGHQLDVDLFKLNLFYYLLNASWMDMQTGLNFRYSNLLAPGKIDQITSWGTVRPNWDQGNIRFAPRALTFGISQTFMFQWFEPWYIDSRFTYGLSSIKFYLDKQDNLLTMPSGYGPTMSVSLGPRFIIDINKNSGKNIKDDPSLGNRLSIGLDLRYSYTKLNTIKDPDDITPMKKIHFQDFGIHITFSVFYGGILTSGDRAKEYYYRGDYVSSSEYFKTFLENYPNHANRNKAEKYLASCREKIPIQLYKEGVEFEKKGMKDKALDRFLEARKKSNKTTRKFIQEKLDNLAILEMEKADQLLFEGKADEAIRRMEKISSFSSDAKQKIPRFRARKLFLEAEKALKFGFYSKSLILLNDALKIDKTLEYEAKTLQYQVGTHLVEMANKISTHDELRSAIQLLTDAKEMAGDLGEENEKILNVLIEKFQADQEKEIKGRIDDRMEKIRLHSIQAETTPPLTVGMTIPDIQALLGPPEQVIERKNRDGKSYQLWVYPLANGDQLQLSFQDYILFKIE